MKDPALIPGCSFDVLGHSLNCFVDDSISVSAADSSKTNVIISAAIQQDLMLASVQRNFFERLFREQTHRSPENQNLPLTIQQTLCVHPKRTCPAISSPLPPSASNTPTILDQQLARLYKRVSVSQARSKNLASPQ